MSEATLFNHILKTAHESGGEILVQLKEYCCDPYKGRVLDLSDDMFSLFHSGPGGGVLWAFRREDIAFCGLVVELPTPLTTLEAPPANEATPKPKPSSTSNPEGD